MSKKSIEDKLKIIDTHIRYIWDEFEARTELRDQYAMAALIGLADKKLDAEEMAEKAFEIADAMMEARE